MQKILGLLAKSQSQSLIPPPSTERLNSTLDNANLPALRGTESMRNFKEIVSPLLCLFFGRNVYAGNFELVELIDGCVTAR